MQLDRTPFLIALRLLGRLGIGLQPAAADVRLVRESVAPREAKLPIEKLCHLILKRELNVPKRMQRGRNRFRVPAAPGKKPARRLPRKREL